jgi:hypothetical protein
MKNPIWVLVHFSWRKETKDIREINIEYYMVEYK